MPFDGVLYLETISPKHSAYKPSKYSLQAREHVTFPRPLFVNTPQTAFPLSPEILVAGITPSIP